MRAIILAAGKGSRLRPITNKYPKPLVKVREKPKKRNLWTEVALDNLFRKKKLIMVPCEVKGLKWYEIDDYSDLKNAERLFAKQ